MRTEAHKRKRIQHKDCETPKKKTTQKNESQTGSSGGVVEGNTTGLQMIQNNDCDTPSIMKTKVTQKNNSQQTGSGDVVEGDTTGLQIVTPRRSTRVKEKKTGRDK